MAGRIGLGHLETLLEGLNDRSIDLTDTELANVAAATFAETVAVVGATTLASTLQVGGLAKTANLTAALGTDLADDTAAITLTSADHGKTFLCLLDGAAKTVNLPASTTLADVGTQITIIQNANLVGSGVLTINANTGNTFCLNSYYIGMSGGAHLVIAATRPADANNRIVITGAATNSAWGIGSKAVFTCVAAGEWHFAMRAESLGNGSDAVAYSTV
mgnify:CR=1 FL=1|jgi:hypothetical protein|tara:strand:- start:514 stop:1167 length:654 start_codon:yes stop_codon:yes gene_type:complete